MTANVDLGRYRRIVQMFWDPEPANDTNKNLPVWCLGKSYKLEDTDKSRANEANSRPAAPLTEDLGPILENEQGSTCRTSPTAAKATARASSESPPSNLLPYTAFKEFNHDGRWPQQFLEDFGSRFWMTYRSDFEPIAKSNEPKATSALSLTMRIRNQISDPNGFSSDSGWGCMIRSGQSLLANTLALLNFGREWRRGQMAIEEKRLLSLFADDPRAAYSIHNFVEHGARACGKYPGEWFGPSATARCIQALVNSHQPQLRVYSTGDGPDVYEDSFMQIARPDGVVFHPTLVLVGTRLGIDKITSVYWEALIAALQMPHSVGIAGGRPSSSHYFVGAQGPHLFYLDPHHTRKALPYYSDPTHYSTEDVDSCHTTRLRRIHMREMDPSMLIGFLIQSEQEWFDWRRGVQHVQGKAIIHVADQNPVLTGTTEEREGAIDEVETLSDDEDAVIAD